MPHRLPLPLLQLVPPPLVLPPPVLPVQLVVLQVALEAQAEALVTQVRLRLSMPNTKNTNFVVAAVVIA